MRRTCLSIVGILLLCFKGWSQSSSDDYKNLKLKVEDINIVSGYYSQTGNHSAVTGGIGTQKLTDYSNTIDLKLVKYDILDRKHSFNFELGIDHHSAASSAYVSTSGASRMGGTRIYPSFNWQVEDNEKKTTVGLGVSYSHEYTYQSFGANFLFSKKSKNENREFTAKGILFIDQVKMVEPSELRPAQIVVSSASREHEGGDNIPSSLRNTFDASLSLSQVVNKRMQVSLLTDAVLQQGYLGLPYYRVYFNDGSPHIENLPSFRAKLPVGMRMNYFLGDRFILKSYYRFFIDNWGVKSHTVSLETPIKITPFISLSPFYRYYIQTAADFFAPYKEHTANDKYYSSNYDYAAFSSNYEGINLRLAPPNGVFGAKGLSALELRYGHYRQTTGLLANNLSLNLTFK
jgi:uncharacterized protein DUF3570